MAGKPRVTVRLESSVVALLDWYAAARAIPPAELAAELIGAGVMEALADADLRALVMEAAGPPPSVPLAALAAPPASTRESLAAALTDLHSCADRLAPEHPAAAATTRAAAAAVEGHLVLLRNAMGRTRRGAWPNGTAPAPLGQEAAE